MSTEETTLLLSNLRGITLVCIRSYILPNYNVIMRRNQEVQPNKKTEIVMQQLCDAIMHGTMRLRQ